MTSSATILVTKAQFLRLTSDANLVLIAERRPVHYILVVTVPLLSLSYDEIEERLSFDEENISVSMTPLPDTDGVGPFNLPRQAPFHLKFKSATIFLFCHYVSLQTLPHRPDLKGDEIEAILDFFGSICCVEHTPLPEASSLGLFLSPAVLGAAFVVGAAFGLVYVLFFK